VAHVALLFHGMQMYMKYFLERTKLVQHLIQFRQNSMQKHMDQISQSLSVFAKRRPIDAGGGQRNPSFPKGRVDEEALELEMTCVPQAGTVKNNPMNGESKQDGVSVHVDPASGRQYTYDKATGDTKWIEG